MIGALAFLTVLGRGRTPSPAQQRWFPAVGASIGALVGLVWWGASQWWPPAVAAALAVLADLLITGLLHVDGLADSADGLLPHLDRQRRLEVMRAPDTGAFGVAVVAIALIMRWATMASIGLGGAQVVAATAGLWALSRGLMAVAMNVLPYARPTGLGAMFASQSRASTVVVGVSAVLLGGAGTMLGRGAVAGAVVALIATAGGVGVLALAKRRIGGYTGDVLGAAGIVLEVVGLVALSARP